MSNKLTIPQKLAMIDEYLEDPRNINEVWVEMLMEYRDMLIEKQDKLCNHSKPITPELFKQSLYEFASRVYPQQNE